MFNADGQLCLAVLTLHFPPVPAHRVPQLLVCKSTSRLYFLSSNWPPPPSQAVSSAQVWFELCSGCDEYDIVI